MGGDVDSNHLDSSAVLGMASWIMAELVRVYHSLSTEEAQRIVESLAERRTQLVWQSSKVRRVLDTSLSLPDQVLVLASTCSSSVSADDLFRWTDYRNRSYFNNILRKLHDRRMIEFDIDDNTVEILTPGQARVGSLISKLASKG